MLLPKKKLLTLGQWIVKIIRQTEVHTTELILKQDIIDQANAVTEILTKARKLDDSSWTIKIRSRTYERLTLISIFIQHLVILYYTYLKIYIEYC